MISLLNEPNTYSPENVDASVMYRWWKYSQGYDNDYPNIIRKQPIAANAKAKRKSIFLPMTLEDYCIKPKRKETNEATFISMMTFWIYRLKMIYQPRMMIAKTTMRVAKMKQLKKTQKKDWALLVAISGIFNL